jgi:LysR family transcriptional regulator, cell division regulator
MPFSVVERHVKRGEVTVHRLAPEDARVETVFITRRDMVRSPALEEFLALVSKQ